MLSGRQLEKASYFLNKMSGVSVNFFPLNPFHSYFWFLIVCHTSCAPWIINIICTNIKVSNNMNKYIQHADLIEWIHFFLCHGFILVGWFKKKYHGGFAKGLTMSPLDIYKFNFSKMANFDIFWLIKQYINFGCISSYLRFSYIST